MSTEREAILRALQQRLVEMADLLGKFLEIEGALPTSTNPAELPKPDPKAQAQVAAYNYAYWKAQALRATKPSVFDHCFHNTFPHWNAPKFVKAVRQAMGRFDKLGAERLFEALQQYEQQFGAFRKEHERVEAHKLAIEAVKETLTLSMES